MDDGKPTSSLRSTFDGGEQVTRNQDGTTHQQHLKILQQSDGRRQRLQLVHVQLSAGMSGARETTVAYVEFNKAAKESDFVRELDEIVVAQLRAKA